MSRDTDAMQYILDLLTQGIFTSTTQQIGFTPHDQITPQLLPFVQAFSSVVEVVDVVPRAGAGTASFTIQLIDAKGKTLVLRDALDSLAWEVSQDLSMQGLVEAARVDVHTVAEVADNERSIAAATVSVLYEDRLLGSSIDVELISFANLSDFTTEVPNEIENSSFIPGGIGFKKVELVIDPFVQAGTGSEFPLDLTQVDFVRLLYYLDWNNSGLSPITNGVNMLLFSAVGTQTYNPRYGRHGWNDRVYDLDNPDVIFGSFDRSTITGIQFIMEYSFTAAVVSNTFGVVLRKFGYSARDVKGNLGRGHHPGF